jgi:hypothetical protein
VCNVEFIKKVLWVDCDGEIMVADTCLYCEWFAVDQKCSGDNRCYDNVKGEYTSFKRTI